MGKRTGVSKSGKVSSSSRSSSSTDSTFKAAAIVLGILWLISAVLAEAGILIEQDWALAVGVIIGIVGIPLAVWTFKRDPAAS